MSCTFGEEEEEGASRGMMVLLEPQMHLQKEVGFAVVYGSIQGSWRGGERFDTYRLKRRGGRRKRGGGGGSGGEASLGGEVESWS